MGIIEQKPIDNIEPKFKVGDWITDNNSTFQIVRVENEWYYADDGDKICFDVAHQYYHLWTIKDAKPGDVLVLETDEVEWVLIYKKIVTSSSDVPHDLLRYYSLLADNYCNLEGVCAMVTEDYEEYLKPATKEQRELLFQKMNEAGYEWNAEKKELKKIEQTSDWSEENEDTIKFLISHFCVYHYNTTFQFTSNKLITHDELLEKIRNLRPQNTWKPSDEQMEALANACDDKILNLDYLNSLYQDLKKLIKN